MAPLKFLGTRTKVVICLVGIALMGYFLYPSIQEGFTADSVTILRVIVLLGFAYFLVKNVQDILTGSDDKRGSS